MAVMASMALSSTQMGLAAGIEDGPREGLHVFGHGVIGGKGRHPHANGKGGYWAWHG